MLNTGVSPNLSRGWFVLVEIRELEHHFPQAGKGVTFLGDDLQGRGWADAPGPSGIMGWEGSLGSSRCYMGDTQRSEMMSCEVPRANCAPGELGFLATSISVCLGNPYRPLPRVLAGEE